MKTKKRKLAVLTLNSFNSIVSFTDWILKTLPHKYPKEKVPDEHILIFLNFIKKEVIDQRLERETAKKFKEKIKRIRLSIEKKINK